MATRKHVVAVAVAAAVATPKNKDVHLFVELRRLQWYHTSGHYRKRWLVLLLRNSTEHARTEIRMNVLAAM